MATSLLQQVREGVDALILDHDALQEDLSLAQATITQIESQRDELYTLLMTTSMALVDMQRNNSPTGARDLIIQNLPTRSFSSMATASSRPVESPTLLPEALAHPAVASSSPECWILDERWLSTPQTRTFLLAAETSAIRGQFQRALIDLDAVLTNQTLTHPARVEAKLLKAAVFAVAGLPARARQQVQQALEIADNPVYACAGMYTVRGKVHLALGRIFYEENRLDEAAWSLSLAVGTEGIEAQVEHWKVMLEKRKVEDAMTDGTKQAGLEDLQEVNRETESAIGE